MTPESGAHRNKSPEPRDPQFRKRLGIFGGTFDPIHTGHLIIASEAMRQVGLDHIVFVPSGRPPHKPDQILSSDSARRMMVELAIEHRAEFSISDVEMRRPGPNYSMDLVDYFHRTNPDADLFFILGADSLRDFHSWREPHRIVERATILVAPRPGVPIDLNLAITSTPGLRGRVEVITMPLIEISSTDIRERSRQGVSFWYQVPFRVEKFIEEHGLYTTEVQRP